MESETPPISQEPSTTTGDGQTDFFADVPGNDDTRKVPVPAQLAVLVAIMLAIFAAPTAQFVFEHLPRGAADQTATARQNAGVEAGDGSSDPFINVALSARSAYVLDVYGEKVLYQKNAEQQLPLASLTKLMTALVASEIVSGDEPVPISTAAILQDGDYGLDSGERFALEELLDLTLMSSSNDGAFAIASAAGALLDANEPAKSFVEAMNIRAKELGLKATYFRNPTGLDVSEKEAGAYGSAKDIALLMKYILLNEPEILEKTRNDKAVFYNEAGAYHLAENTNEVINRIPGIIGSKTGYTDLSGGNLVVAFDAGFNRPVVVAVLGSTRTRRFDDVLTLVEASRLSVNK